jgi:hypothetical protein
VIADTEGRLGHPLEESLTEFLRRSLHGLELWADDERSGSAKCLHTFSPSLLEESPSRAIHLGLISRRK